LELQTLHDSNRTIFKFTALKTSLMVCSIKKNKTTELLIVS
jgi:hypothetical protein